MSRPLTASIDLSAFAHNVQLVSQHCRQSSICAIIKANAYGHGAVVLARAIQRSLQPRIQSLGVCSVEEALQLRQANISLPIVLLEGIFSSEEARIAHDQKLHPVVHSSWQAERLLPYWQRGSPAVWIKINSGMNRLGFDASATAQTITLFENRQCDIVLMTHFSSADTDNSVTLQQYRYFCHQVEMYTHHLSLGNSATVLYHSSMVGDIARPGIMLYGVTPDNSNPVQAGLRSVMTLHSEIIAIHHLTAGDSVGYEGRWTARENTTIGVVACGYADGYPREVSTDAYVTIEGVQCPLAGRVSMDMLSVDLSACPQARIGSAVELWGNNPTVNQVAQWHNTIGYTLLSRINQRVRLSYSIGA